MATHPPYNWNTHRKATTMTIRTSFGTMYSRFGVNIENVNLDPGNDLDLTDEARAAMARDASNVCAQHAEKVLNSVCPDGEFSVFPNGEIHVNLNANLEPLENDWESVSEEIGMGPDALVLYAVIDEYINRAEAGEYRTK